HQTQALRGLLSNSSIRHRRFSIPRTIYRERRGHRGGRSQGKPSQRWTMSFGQAWQLVKESASAWVNDYASSMGAAIAYYTVFSIAPLLLIVIAVAGFFFGSEVAERAIGNELPGLLGEDGARAGRGLLESASSPSGCLRST